VAAELNKKPVAPPPAPARSPSPPPLGDAPASFEVGPASVPGGALSVEAAGGRGGFGGWGATLGLIDDLEEAEADLGLTREDYTVLRRAELRGSKAVAMRPCMFHWPFSIRNKNRAQKHGVKMTAPP
jgi:hypothetical protein